MVTRDPHHDPRKENERGRCWIIPLAADCGAARGDGYPPKYKIDGITHFLRGVIDGRKRRCIAAAAPSCSYVRATGGFGPFMEARLFRPHIRAYHRDTENAEKHLVQKADPSDSSGINGFRGEHCASNSDPFLRARAKGFVLRNALGDRAMRAPSTNA
jgi:hypothetical protein